MTKEELKNIITLGETTTVQFKQTIDNQDKVAAEMIAFANTAGGFLIFGVEDRKGEIIGLDYPELQKINNKISTVANEIVKPQLFLTTEAFTIDGKNLLVVYIQEGIAKPYKDNNGIIWVKQGADKRKLTDNSEILRLFQQSSNLLADEMQVYDTTIDDIDERVFADYFKREFGRSYQERGLNYEQALRAKRVIRNEKATLAGLLFFGKEPQGFKPAFTVKTVSYVGNDLSGLTYRSKPADLKGTIPELFNQAMMFLKANLHYLQNGQGFNSVGELEISPIVLEEILQNALIHRDYLKNAPIRIFIFDNRVEIISPGRLPNSLTVAEIAYGNPVIRNNQIVSYAKHTLPFIGLGTGLKRSLEIQPDIQFINDREGEQFTVIIPRKINKNS
jgi:predicted HTH transcriptional regulator